MRPTAAGLKAQFKKLARPFRSPLVNSEDALVGREGVYASARAHSARPKDPPKAKTESEGDEQSVVKLDKVEEDAPTAPLTKPYSASVTKQFKCPLAAPGSASQAAGSSTGASRTVFSSVKPMPTIQVLQGRLQKLKQAIKIKNEQSLGDEQNLEALVTKWRTVGRDVAWLVWDTVKDIDPGEGLNAPLVKEGWGEDDVPRHEKREGEEERRRFRRRMGLA